MQIYLLPGTTIISDYWKPYDNHSIEFVIINGDHTNKIEGHWRKAKKHLPPFGVPLNVLSLTLLRFIIHIF